MDCPKDIKGAKRKLWDRLFRGFRPANPIEAEMAKRYLDWLCYYEEEKVVVAVEGTVKAHDNGTSGTNPHFSNMKLAEDQMRRLWEKIKGSMVDDLDDVEDAGQFAEL